MWRPFQTTIWASIRLAKEGRSTALNDFARKYREPVIAFIHQQGYSPDDAEDLAQEAFMIVFRDRLLVRAEEARSRFRTFLLGVVKNVLRNSDRIRDAAKRGGGRREVSLDRAISDDTALGSILQAPEADDDFDQKWAHHLVRLALDQLALHHPKAHDVLKLHLDERLSYDDIGKRLGLSFPQVDNFMRQAKSKLAELVRAEIATYCSSADEFDEEISRLGGHLVKS